MSSTVENMKFPVGSKENPAMTCKELMDVDDIQDGKAEFKMLKVFFLPIPINFKSEFHEFHM